MYGFQCWIGLILNFWNMEYDAWRGIEMFVAI